jgi:hypothetical protein
MDFVKTQNHRAASTPVLILSRACASPCAKRRENFTVSLPSINNFNGLHPPDLHSKIPASAPKNGVDFFAPRA